MNPEPLDSIHTSEFGRGLIEAFCDGHPIGLHHRTLESEVAFGIYVSVIDFGLCSILVVYCVGIGQIVLSFLTVPPSVQRAVDRVCSLGRNELCLRHHDCLPVL